MRKKHHHLSSFHDNHFEGARLASTPEVLRWWISVAPIEAQRHEFTRQPMCSGFPEMQSFDSFFGLVNSHPKSYRDVYNIYIYTQLHTHIQYIFLGKEKSFVSTFLQTEMFMALHFDRQVETLLMEVPYRYGCGIWLLQQHTVVEDPEINHPVAPVMLPTQYHPSHTENKTKILTTHFLYWKNVHKMWHPLQ